MVVLYPTLLVTAVVLAWRSRARRGGRGPTWFAGWTLAGFLMSFSFITGLSIGLFMLPVAALVLLAVARISPHPAEASGFFAGVAATGLLVLVIQST
jgi:hypothetical protein